MFCSGRLFQASNFCTFIQLSFLVEFEAVFVVFMECLLDSLILGTQKVGLEFGPSGFIGFLPRTRIYCIQSNLRTKDTLGTIYYKVLCREVVLFSEVQNVLEQ